MMAALYYAALVLLIPGAFIAVFFRTVDRVAAQGTLGPVHNRLILVPSGFSQEARIDAKDAAQ